MAAILVRNVRPWGAEAVDILIQGTTFVEFGPSIQPPEGTTELDGAGLVALPGFINSHAHLDKSWWGKPWQSYGGEATTQGRIRHERENRDRLDIPSQEVTRTVIREMLRHGTTAFRTHIDVDLGVQLRGIAALRAALAELDGAVQAQIVAFPQDGVLRRPGVMDLLDRAAAEGADFVGGLDPAAIDRDPVGQLSGLFEIAQRRNVGVDIHLHDPDTLGGFQFELIAEKTRDCGLGGRVNISHGLALGDGSAARQAELIQMLADSGISMTTVAPINASRLPLDALLDAGIPVGVGTDGFRDLWGPFGDGDLLRVVTRLAQLAGWSRDEKLIRAAHLATTEAAVFVGRDVHDLVPGARADLVLLDAENVMDVVVRAPRRELVIAGGQLMVQGGELV